MAANSGFRWELLPLLSADSYRNTSSFLEAMNSEIANVKVNSATQLERKNVFNLMAYFSLLLVVVLSLSNNFLSV